ncbi:hypothetical protein HK096_010338 [Nowakowskiella sp. JEL0078]|nr:hypothetical protein HK096_010338 [Nowakowskiella sp. JEL0078]
MSFNKLLYKQPASNWDEALPIGNGRLGAMVFGGLVVDQLQVLCLFFLFVFTHLISVLQLNEDSVWSGTTALIDRNNPSSLSHLQEIRDLLTAGKIQEAEALTCLSMGGIPETQRRYQSLGELKIRYNYPAALGGQNDVPIPIDRHNSLSGLRRAPVIPVPSNYRRELDLSLAVSNVSYTLAPLEGSSFEAVHYEREYFVSEIDQAVIMRISASKLGAVSLEIQLYRDPSYIEEIRSEYPDTTSVTLVGNSRNVMSTVKVILDRNDSQALIEVIGRTVVVKDATLVTIVIGAATTFYHNEYATMEKYLFQQIKSLDEKLALIGYESVRKQHSENHGILFSKASLRLGCLKRLDDSEDFDVSITERLLRYSKHISDPQIEENIEGDDGAFLTSLLFNYGRYLLICCSRPGTQAANLQGIWNQHMDPPWGSRFTININTQMNYWPAEIANLSECHYPLFDLLERMRVPGRQTAKKMYGVDFGFVAHHNTDIYGDCVPSDEWLPASFWPLGAAWLATHLWERFEFTLDTEFLKEKAYPILAECAQFFLGYLFTIKSKDGTEMLVTGPSSSAENTYALPSGAWGTICLGPSMDSQILFELFTIVIEAHKILGYSKSSDSLNDISNVRSSKFISKIKETRDRLPKPEIGKHGQIMEWFEDHEEPEPGHRHISQLWMLYPGKKYLFENTHIKESEKEKLLEASEITLLRRLSHGGGHTGWSRAWIINLYSRLQKRSECAKHIQQMIANSMYPNLFDKHPPFQIDGNFGFTSGVAEMLVQSNFVTFENADFGNLRDDLHVVILLLPAAPTNSSHCELGKRDGWWAEGRAVGLCTRGGFEVTISWEVDQKNPNGKAKLKEVVLKSKKGISCTVRYFEKSVVAKTEVGEVRDLTKYFE